MRPQDKLDDKARKLMNEVSSPCVSICALDEDDICVGCYRSGNEITRWSQLNQDEKKQVMDKVREREAKSYI